MILATVAGLLACARLYLGKNGTPEHGELMANWAVSVAKQNSLISYLILYRKNNIETLFRTLGEE